MIIYQCIDCFHFLSTAGRCCFCNSEAVVGDDDDGLQMVKSNQRVLISRNKREGYYVGKHLWFVVGDRGFGTGKIHHWVDGKHRDRRGNYMTTVNRRVVKVPVPDPGVGRGLRRHYML